ncbi:hypothetical protein ASPZODRAFT_59289 [Penicilliopsis zonata CBS 506.65]|uniref:Uncharacterized protein n=1 Tax=Penicilliopsis zonata CBS 506.65 TaxID=1073090 RepID=A0A1L9SSR1_9EURO|nr:hypothetical protein ASPZODRAFT_59289 [Penicilliopsis zonata CBS 506.65]OJJ50131.1 hypothetical protein ASPZODRAFT_59289 [Penicilliopsis zonata CBS 506.65]
MSQINTYSGLWINWSHGLFRGATLTLPQEYAGLLTSFLAIFVSFSGGMFWRILSYAIHQCNTTSHNKQRDALHLSRQVLLRNSGTSSGGAAWSMTVLGFSMHNRASHAILRMIPLVLLALLTMAVFGVSGVFTSYITKMPGNSTLIRGPHCGGFSLTSASSTSIFALSNVEGKALADTYQAATYASQCYQNESSLNCGTYVQPNLPFTTEQNVSCPFRSDLCNPTNQSAIAMDTGYLDSQTHFGINAAPWNRIKFRRRATCVPVYGGDFATMYNNSDGTHTVDIWAGTTHTGLADNLTFTYSSATVEGGIGYQLSAVYALYDPLGTFEATQWNPISALNTTDSDITLMMLAQNDMGYENPCYDPWITATLKLANISESIWEANDWVSLLGCIDQYQICNPTMTGDSGCSKLGGLESVAVDLTLRAPELGFNDLQVATISRFLTTQSYRGMYYNVQGRGANALNAQQKAWANLLYYLPPDQWEIEVTRWFATSLALEQAWSVEWATSPTNFDYSPSATVDVGWEYSPPTNAVQRKLCRNQLIRSSDTHISLSILGMAVILIVGGIIIIIGFSIDTVVGWFQRGHSRYRREQWLAEETLELHGVAYRVAGFPLDAGGEFPPSSTLGSAAPGVVEEEYETKANGYVPVTQAAGLRE